MYLTDTVVEEVVVIQRPANRALQGFYNNLFPDPNFDNTYAFTVRFIELYNYDIYDICVCVYIYI